MSQRPLSAGHPDSPIVAPIVATILRKAGGVSAFASDVPRIFRTAVDEVIDAPRTGRFTISQTEKTEKTYLGTKIEILLRSYLGLPRGGVLDLSVDGVEVDIKNTMGANWSVPVEAVGRPCLLNRLNETAAKCAVGVVIAKDEYLNPGKNRDLKRTLSRVGKTHIWWILLDHPYPPNFWEVLPVSQRDEIMGAGGGTMRLAALFERIQHRPISRIQVQALAQQQDYMKRVRRNGGARDILGPKGIAILWGRGDKEVIKRLGLGPVAADEFVSFTPTHPDQVRLLRQTGHID